MRSSSRSATLAIRWILEEKGTGQREGRGCVGQMKFRTVFNSRQVRRRPGPTDARSGYASCGDDRAGSTPRDARTDAADSSRPTEVHLRIDASGVCHSDETIRRQGMGGLSPVILGHEGAGTVLEVGSEVRDLAPGESGHRGISARVRIMLALRQGPDAALRPDHARGYPSPLEGRSLG